MSTLLATSNPTVVASEIDPGRDRRRPYAGQIALFHQRPGESRAGKPSSPAVVTRVDDDDHVEIMIVYAADDFHTRWSVPRKTEQNPINAWTFNDHDEIHYLRDQPKLEVPAPTGHLNWDDVKAMHAEIGVLRNKDGSARRLTERRAKIMDDLALIPGEQPYFDSAGTDMSGVLAETGRSSATTLDGTPELTDAERRFFETKGDVSHDLLREHGLAREQQPSQPLRPELQAIIDHAKAGHLDERISHAKTQARFDLLREATTPPPLSAPEPEPQLDPESDIFRYIRNLGDRLTTYEQQIQIGQAEMAEEGRYRASLDAAVRQEPAVYKAYHHLLRSRAAELMASRFPSATVDQLRADQAILPPELTVVRDVAEDL